MKVDEDGDRKEEPQARDSKVQPEKRIGDEHR